MAKKTKLLLLARKLFSAMLSVLHPRRSSQSPPLSTTSSHTPVIHHGTSFPPPSTLAAATTVVVDVDAFLLRRSDNDDLFPYFMLAAMEAGGYLRGLALLLLYPLLHLLLLPRAAAVRVMAAAAFCGLRAARFRAGRAVLPKWLLEDLAAESFDAVRTAAAAGGRVVFVTAMPRVMVDGFLREYLFGMENVVVVAPEMEVMWGFFTGAMEDAAAGELVEQEEEGVVGLAGSPEFLDRPAARCCKEVFVVSSDEKRRPLPKNKYPKPMVFHDGRLAFLPTFTATLAMLTWLPFGAILGAARLAVALTVPYKYSTPILAATGMSWRLAGDRRHRPSLPAGGRGQLFACNHRTLIDPVYVSVALDRQVRAVSYSLSRLSELISPIGRTVRLTRDRASDGAAMASLLAGGDLVVVCPEGTTCREPYLLRFSPLFAELADDVVPVGIAVETSMFYATTAGGLKCFDPLYYMVNPRMCYTVEFLEKVDTSLAKEGKVPSVDVANVVQRRMGEALGYGCTMLTRKDKYLMLAGNDGVVRRSADDGKSAAAAEVVGKEGNKKSDEKSN